MDAKSSVADAEINVYDNMSTSTGKDVLLIRPDIDCAYKAELVAVAAQLSLPQCEEFDRDLAQGYIDLYSNYNARESLLQKDLVDRLDKSMLVSLGAMNVSMLERCQWSLCATLEITQMLSLSATSLSNVSVTALQKLELPLLSADRTFTSHMAYQPIPLCSLQDLLSTSTTRPIPLSVAPQHILSQHDDKLVWEETPRASAEAILLISETLFVPESFHCIDDLLEQFRTTEKSRVYNTEEWDILTPDTSQNIIKQRELLPSYQQITTTPQSTGNSLNQIDKINEKKRSRNLRPRSSDPMRALVVLLTSSDSENTTVTTTVRQRVKKRQAIVTATAMTESRNRSNQRRHYRRPHRSRPIVLDDDDNTPEAIDLTSIDSLCQDLPQTPISLVTINKPAPISAATTTYNVQKLDIPLMIRSLTFERKYKLKIDLPIKPLTLCNKNVLWTLSDVINPLKMVQTNVQYASNRFIRRLPVFHPRRSLSTLISQSSIPLYDIPMLLLTQLRLLPEHIIDSELNWHVNTCHPLTLENTKLRESLYYPIHILATKQQYFSPTNVEFTPLYIEPYSTWPDETEAKISTPNSTNDHLDLTVSDSFSVQCHMRNFLALRGKGKLISEPQAVKIPISFDFASKASEDDLFESAGEHNLLTIVSNVQHNIKSTKDILSLPFPNDISDVPQQVIVSLRVLQQRQLIKELTERRLCIIERDYSYLKFYCSSESTLFEADVIVDTCTAIVFFPYSLLGQRKIGDDRPAIIDMIGDVLMRLCLRYSSIYVIMESYTNCVGTDVHLSTYQPEHEVYPFAGPAHQAWHQLQDLCIFFSNVTETHIGTLLSMSANESAWLVSTIGHTRQSQSGKDLIQEQWLREEVSTHERLLTVFVNPYMAQVILYILGHTSKDYGMSAVQRFAILSYEEMQAALSPYLPSKHIDLTFDLLNQPLSAAESVET